MYICIYVYNIYIYKLQTCVSSFPGLISAAQINKHMLCDFQGHLQPC